MNEYLINKDTIVSLADVVRFKTNKTNMLTLNQIITEVEGFAQGVDEIAIETQAIQGEYFDHSNLSAFENSLVTAIGGAMFSGCTKLTAVSCPECTVVCAAAFRNCLSLSFAELPKCTTINRFAFAGDTSLSSLHLPNCSTIGDYAFQSCISLTAISFSQCSYIGASAFQSCTSLTTVDFPMCEYIGNCAFESCTNLTTVNFPVCSYLEDGSGGYGSGVFYYCSNLVSVSLSECTHIGSAAFYGCSNLTTAFLPKCNYIGERAFYNCTSLYNITLAECSYIGTYAFYNCSNLNLEGIVLSQCLYIGTNAFPDCSFISEFSAPQCEEFGGFQNYSNVITVSMPKCTYVGAFKSCYNLQSVYLPMCSMIRESAFYECSSLTAIDLPECSIMSGKNHFSGCSNLTTVSLPKCVSVGTQAFYACTNLSSIYLPICETIYGQGLYYCKSLSEIDLPECTYIGTYAFKACYNLTTVSIPKCSSIGYCAFQECSSLSYISLPSCTYIDGAAFSSCTSLMSVYLTGSSVASMSTFVFDTTPIAKSSYTGSYGSIYVPASLVSAYQSAPNWSTYKSRIAEIPEPSIGDVNNRNTLFNTTSNINVPLYVFDTEPESVSVVSSNEQIITISNIQSTKSKVSFDITSYAIEGSAEITVTVVCDGQTYTDTFNVSVFEVNPEPTYSIESVGATYGFTLNSSGYYESQNKGLNKTFAMCKLNINAPVDSTMYLDCINYAESNYDFGILSNLNTTLTSSYTADSSNVYKSFKGSSKSSVQTITYDVPSGEHYIYIKFIKDSSSHQNNDSLQFKVRFD